ncbi:MAG: hypothetical protein KatS3mg010_1382 [Acidimicrobiia bacterium]|nr:MAG: hypothetical protein KatS3mg010_1382 [Acidimicrobiia bacterium]
MLRRADDQTAGAGVFAQSKGVTCVEIDLERLRDGADPDLTLF